MVFTPIEWMALILIVVSAIKLVVVLVNPKAWYDSVAKKVWASPNLMMVVSLVLAAVVLYYLLLGGITIVEILAVMLFLSLFIAAGAAIYKKEILGLAQKLLKDKSMIKKSWLYIILWAVLIVWGAKVLLF